jgi:magnesium chelatase family protein
MATIVKSLSTKGVEGYVVNLAPSDLKKSGSHFDLPIALSLLMEANQFRIKRKEEFAFIGELSLNARLRGCTGVLQS